MKTDYNKSMLRFGAVVVASASMLGAASTMNAAPVAAPVYADDEVVDEMSENEIANANDNQKIEALQEKLTEAIKMLQEDYPRYEEEGMAKFNEIGTKILAMQTSCNDAFDNLKEGEVYVSPLTDAWEQEMDSDIDDVLYAADQARILGNEKAYGDYMTTLSTLQEELSAACAESNEYYGFINWGLQESIYNELETLHDEAEKAYQGVQEAGYFDLTITDDANSIRGAIEKLVSDASKAYEKDRKEKNEKAYGDYMTELTLLQQELTAVVNGEYAEYVNRGKAESIYNELETLHDEAEKYYDGVEEAGVFDLNITEDANAIRGAIADLLLSAKNAAAYDGVNDQLEGLRDTAKAAFGSDNDYASFLKAADVKAVNDKIDALETEVELERVTAAKEKRAFNATKFDAEIKAISDMIAKVKQDAKDALYQEKVRVAKNDLAYSNYVTGIAALQKSLDDATAEDNYYAEYINRGLAESIQSEIDILSDDAKTEYDSVKTEGWFNLDIKDSANSIEGAIATLVTKAKAAFAAAQDAAYGDVITELSELSQELTGELNGETEYSAYVNEEEAKAIYDKIEALVETATNKYENLKEGEAFNFNITTQVANIKAEIEKLVDKARKAYEAVRVAKNEAAYKECNDIIKNLNDKLEEATAEDVDYYKFINWGLEESISNEIGNLQDEVDAEKRATEEAGVFSLSIEDEANSIEGAIQKLIDQAENALVSERNAANAETNAAWKEAIQNLRDELAAAIDPAAHGYADYLSKATVEKILGEINKLEADRAANWEKAKDEANYEFPALDGEDETISDEIKAMVAKAQAMYDDVRKPANQKAYNAYAEEVEKLQAEFDAATAISNDYYQYLNRGRVESINNEIDILRTDGQDYFDEVQADPNGIFDLSIADDASMIRGYIAQLVADAKKVMENPVAYNDLAYNQDLGTLEEMQTTLDNTWENLCAEYPGVEYWDEGGKFVAGLYDDLVAMKAAVEAAYADLSETDMYVSPITEGIDTFYNDLGNLIEAAPEYSKNYVAWNADTTAAQEAYQKIYAAEDEGMEVLGEDGFYESPAVMEVDEEVWAYYYDNIYEPVQNAWYAYQDGEAESYVSPDLTAAYAELDKLIEKLVNVAIQTDVKVVEATAEKAEYYTIEGRKSNRAVRGQINIVRTADGKIQKVMVK